MKRARPTHQKPRAKAPGRARRNPAADEAQRAAALSEAFHGRPARTSQTIAERSEERTTLCQLGELVSLTLRAPAGKVELEFSAGAKLAASPDGRTLYIVGGDQSVNLRSLGIPAALQKDHIELGDCIGVIYNTEKSFHNFVQSNYKHRLGEDGGRPPKLCYDALSERLFFVGGTYQVRPEGIVN